MLAKWRGLLLPIWLTCWKDRVLGGWGANTTYGMPRWMEVNPSLWVPAI